MIQFFCSRAKRFVDCAAPSLKRSCLRFAFLFGCQCALACSKRKRRRAQPHAIGPPQADAILSAHTCWYPDAASACAGIDLIEKKSKNHICWKAQDTWDDAGNNGGAESLEQLQEELSELNEHESDLDLALMQMKDTIENLRSNPANHKLAYVTLQDMSGIETLNGMRLIGIKYPPGTKLGKLYITTFRRVLGVLLLLRCCVCTRPVATLWHAPKLWVPALTMCCVVF